MEYIFVLGKNTELSVAEIRAYSESRGLGIEFASFSKSADGESATVVFTKDDLEPEKVIKDLGGTIKVCQVIEKVDEKFSLDINRAFPGTRDKVRFGVSVYSDKDDAKKLWEDIVKELKKNAREQKIKLIHVTPNKGKTLRHLEVSHKLMERDGIELVVSKSGSKLYIGKTVSVHNPHEFMKRDTGRPYQRTMLSIPPRLAKILINMSGAVEGETLLDPFCGIGTILAEALLMNLDVIGVDRDPSAIKGARKNLEWLEREYEINRRWELIRDDAAEIPNHIEPLSIDGVATEPYLGPPLKGRPSKRQATKIIKEVRGLYVITLKQIRKVLRNRGRIAIVSPNLLTVHNEELKMDMQTVAEEAGYKVMSGPILDADIRHLTRREIYVLEKRDIEDQ